LLWLLLAKLNCFLLSFIATDLLGKNHRVGCGRLIERRSQHAIEHRQAHLVLFHPHHFEMGLMVETTGGAVVARGIAGCNVVRRTKAAGDLVEDFLLEVRKSS
jgi:hypothetical protein